MKSRATQKHIIPLKYSSRIPPMKFNNGYQGFSGDIKSTWFILGVSIIIITKTSTDKEG